MNWLGLAGETDWNLMRLIVEEDFTFVTNNAMDFRKLYSRTAVHAGLIVIIQQVAPSRQRDLFDALLGDLGPEEFLVNELVEIELEGDTAVVSRFEFPMP